VKIPDGKSKDMGMKSKVQVGGASNGVVLLELRRCIYGICMILQTVFYVLYTKYIFIMCSIYNLCVIQNTCYYIA